MLPQLLLAASGDIYRNDFSTRTSATALPGDRWMSYNYDPGTTLYYNYQYAGGATTSNLWEKSDEYQDAWVRAWMLRKARKGRSWSVALAGASSSSNLISTWSWSGTSRMLLRNRISPTR